MTLSLNPPDVILLFFYKNVHHHCGRRDFAAVPFILHVFSKVNSINHSVFSYIFKNDLPMSYMKKARYVKILSFLLLFTGAYLIGAGAAYLSDHSRSGSYTDSSEDFAQAVTIPASAEGSWGLSFPEDGELPVGNATIEELAQYDAYYAQDTDEKIIYLTFDAGYENGNTEPILDALKKHNVSATFFVVGTYIESEPDLIRRMVEEGHTVGNHTWHHPDMSQISDMESFQKEIADVEDAFFDVTGQEMTGYYRPPQGKYNESNLQMAKELGYKTFFWSLAYVDWYQNDQPTEEEAFDKLLGRIHPGAIVLLHSTSSTNAAILDELLTRWEDMGYQIRPLSELVE